MLGMWTENSMEPRQVNSRLRNNGDQFLDELGSREHDRARTVTPLRFKLVHHILAAQLDALLGNRRSQDISAQALELGSIVLVNIGVGVN